MCGIIGYVGSERVAPQLLEGLKRLEYRGYDSAGIAVIESDRILSFRRAGKVEALERAIDIETLSATIGIGHTRWATHGAPTDANAHPHFDGEGRIAVIHNGIIENYSAIKERLIAAGHRFCSDTDTEVLAHLIGTYLDGDLLSAVRLAVGEATGAFAIAVLSVEDPDRLVVARRGSPLVIGQGTTGTFVASDVPAMLGHASEVIFLEDDDLAVLCADAVHTYDMDGCETRRPSHQVTLDPVAVQKGGFKHFMSKEIHEQGRAIGETIREKLSADGSAIELDGLDGVPQDFDQIYLISCGTAFHASLAAEYLWEDMLPVPVRSMIASEFRLRRPHITSKTIVVAVSQSGETIDTLMAMRHARSFGASVIALVNNEHSALDREADATIYTRAGLEIGVAATKTFTAQIAALGLLGLRLAELQGTLDDARRREELQALALLPGRLVEALQIEPAVHQLAEELHSASDVLFLARGVLYPIALEGALKLKEISYIHAEGYAAGEMKHGPIALIDELTPVVLLLAQGVAFDKVLANMEEVKARNGRVVVVTDAPETPALKHLADDILEVPRSVGIARAILFAVPMQLLAYHIAVWRGTDVDQPRNLAKTVTVE